MNHTKLSPAALGLCACAAGALFAPSATMAGGFLVRTHSAEGFGTALAGVAAGESLSFSHWNPAALTGVQGFEIETMGNVILPSLPIRPDAATNALVAGAGGTPTEEADVGTDSIVPALYAGVRLNDRMTAGVAVTSPFGEATKSPFDWSGQVYSRTSKILSVNVSPMVAYQVNDALSVGGGVMVQYFSGKLSQAAGVETGAPSAGVSGNDTAVGINLGARLALSPATQVGVGYRSAVGHELEGELDLAAIVLPAVVDLTTPDIVSAGFRHDLSAGTRVMGTVEWANWSRIDVLEVASGGAVVATVPAHYRDGWLISVGAERDFSDSFTARAGYGYEIAPITDGNRDTRLPEVNQHIFSAGLSYAQSERLTLDIAFTHSTAAQDGPINIQPGNPRYVGLPFSADSDLDVSIISAALSVRFP